MKSFFPITLVILFGLIAAIYAVPPEPDDNPPWENQLPSEDGNGAGLPPSDSDLGGAGAYADLATAKIQSLAEGLAAGEGGPNNPAGAKRIFDYVHNHISYLHYFGCKKGAQLTLLEGSGGDFDQCALLVSLLRSAGYTANYQFGLMSIPFTNTVPGQDIQHWLNLTVPGGNLTTVSNYLYLLCALRNFPNLDAGSTNSVYPFILSDGNFNFAWPRTWVVLSIGGTNCYLDPAFKASTLVTNSGWVSASGILKSDLLQAAGGTTNGANSVQGLNETNLAAKLTTYTANFLNFLRTNQPNASPLEVIGGWKPATPATANLPSSLPFTIITNVAYTYYSSFPVQTWTNIPDVYLYTLRIQAGNVDQTYPFAQLAGQRLSVTFTGVAPQQLQLWLEDTLQDAETNASGSAVTITLTAKRPFGYWSWGIDTLTVPEVPDVNPRVEAKSYLRNAAGYALVYAFEPNGDLLRQRQEKLSEYLRQGYTNGSRQVLTETLNIAGQNWFLQTALSERLLAAQKSVLLHYNHRVGRVSQESAYYIDVGLQLTSLVSANGFATADTQAVSDFFDVTSYFASAMEHGVLEQMQGGNAVSTVKVLQLANLTNTIFRATAANWSSVSSQLVNYPLGDINTKGTLAYFGNRISGGSQLLLPGNGNMTVGIWHGPAYVDRRSSSIGMFIVGYSGGYNSGFGSFYTPPVVNYYYSSPVFNNPVPLTAPPLRGADPVNMADGSFTVDSTDLSLGKSDPQGLAFARYYSSAQRNFNNSALGYGWTHNYRIYASDQPDVRTGLGLATPYDMAAYLVATKAALDVYTNSSTAKEWAVVALIAKWGVDQLRSNAVSIVMGKEAVEFTRQPDGTFTPPAGVKMSLTRSNNLYALQQRHGNTFVFDSSNRVQNIRDPFGKTNSFIYTNTTGNLIQVKDAYNRTLTFNYTATNKLSNVTDSTGRSVTFGIDTNLNLTAVTDPENKTSTFLYDTNHQITAVTNALSQLVTTNVYDEFARVTVQYTQGDTNKTWRLYWSGWDNVEQDPAGGRRLYSYDDQHRLIALSDALGNLSQSFYDGQDHVLMTFSPLNETNRFQFDGRQNLLRSIDALNYTNQFFYDTQDRLATSVDARGDTNRFGYNTQHQLTGSTNGAGDWVTFVYNTNSDGTLASHTDAGGTTGYGYDNLGQLNGITYPGSLGSEGFLNSANGDLLSHTNARQFVTSFQYNLRRELTNAIAPTNVTAKVAYDAVGNVLSTTDARGFSANNAWSATRKLLATTLPGTPQGVPVTTNVYDNRDWLMQRIRNPASSISATTSFTDDAAQRLIAVTDPLLRSLKYGYDADGRQNAATNAATEITRQAFNARGELLQTLTPALTTINPGYDAAGNQITLTNRRAKVWQFQFDGANRLTNTTTPTLKETRVTYDSRGLVSTVREPSLQTATNFYDAKGRLTNRVDVVASTRFDYDANDNLTAITNVGQASRLSQTFDAYDRMLSHTNADGYLLQYRYDPNGNLTNLIYPGNRTVTYAYDSLNRLTNVMDWANRKTSIEYDLASRVKKITRPNGTVREINYDIAGQTTNIVEKLTNNAPVAFFKLNFNAAARVEWELGAPPPHAYTNATRTMTFDDDNRIATFNGNSVTHDADGNMTYGPLTNNTFVAYGYDARNRLTNANGASYTYDPAGNRTSLTNGTNVVRFVVNPNSQLLMRVRSGVTNYYIYGLGLLYEITETASTANTLTYHYDFRGSTVALTDGNGVPTDRIEYSAYGSITYRAGTSDTPFLYNGCYGVQTDPNGLLYMRARYYNPYLCRFINADPSGFSGGLNSYAYADGNPVSMIDPFGLGAIEDQFTHNSWIDQVWNGLGIDNSFAAQERREQMLIGFANTLTLGLAGDASSALTGYDFSGNRVYGGERTVASINLAMSIIPVDRLGVAGAKIATGAAERLSAVGSRAIERQITVIGSRADSMAAAGWAGHNVLNIPNWSAKANIQWLDSAIRRGDEIYVATDPVRHSALLNSLPNRPFSAFLDLELPYLQSKGYIQQGLRMVPTP